MLFRTQSSQAPISDVAKQDDGKQQQEQSQKLCGTMFFPDRELALRCSCSSSSHLKFTATKLIPPEVSNLRCVKEDPFFF